MNDHDFIILRSKMSPAAEHIVKYFLEIKATNGHARRLKDWFDMLGALTAIGMSYYGEEHTRCAIESALDVVNSTVAEKSSDI